MQVAQGDAELATMRAEITSLESRNASYSVSFLYHFVMKQLTLHRRE